jgi:hypothetical protein
MFRSLLWASSRYRTIRMQEIHQILNKMREKPLESSVQEHRHVHFLTLINRPVKWMVKRPNYIIFFFFYPAFTSLKARCNGDSLRAGTSSWQVDYPVSDRQQDGKVALFWTRGRAIRVSKKVESAAVATGQLHLPLALAARKLSPLQRAFTSSRHLILEVPRSHTGTHNSR